MAIEATLAVKDYENKQQTISDASTDYGGGRSGYGVAIVVNKTTIEEGSDPQSDSSWVIDLSSKVVYRIVLFRVLAYAADSSASNTEAYYNTTDNLFKVKDDEGNVSEASGADIEARLDDGDVPIETTEYTICYTPNDTILYHTIKDLRIEWLSDDSNPSDDAIIKREKAFIAVDAHFNDGNFDRVEKILQSDKFN